MDIDVTSLFDRRATDRWNRTCAGDIFERVATVSPDAEALVGAPGAYGDPAFERLSYGAADALANRIANGFRATGIGRGDRILLICENSVESFVAKIGAAKIGAVVVPVNPAQTADVLAHAVDLTRPKLVMADAEHGLLPASIGLPVDITIQIGDPTGAQGRSFQDFCASAASDAPESVVHGDDIWQILFTSGTTAMPKGVMISHAHAYLTALSFALSYTRGLAHESHLRLACFAPITFHIGDQAYALPPLFTGGTAILGRRYRPDAIARTIAAERATAVIGGGIQLAGTLIDEMEALGRDAMSSLTFFQFGLGVLAPGPRGRLEALCPGISLLSIAGQTESVSSHRFAASVCDRKYAEVIANGANLVGKPTPLMASRVADLEDGTSSVPTGRTGELVYRSPIMTAGYYRDEEATRQAFAGGWFHSGDLGVADEDGHRYIVGRLKDMIKTGGENVSSARVEAVIAQHEAIAQVAVIGLPDPVWGEAVTAVVVPRPGSTVEEKALIAFCRQRLAGHETPKRVIMCDALPVDFIGKIQKFVLREMLCKKDFIG